MSKGQMSLEGPRGGETYEAKQDWDRLNKQHIRVWTVMRDGGWHELRDIADRTQDPEASVSARLRDFRKERYGGHTVERKRITEGRGTWVYRLLWNRDYPIPTGSQVREAWYGSAR